MGSSARQATDKRVPAGCCVQGSPAWQGLSRDSGAARLHESKRENGHVTAIRWWIEAGSIHFTRGWRRAIDLTAKRLFAGHVIHDDCPRRPPKIALCHRLESLQGHGAIRRGHAHIHYLWVVQLADITRVQGRKPISLGVVWECRDTHLLPRRVPDLQLDSFPTNLSKKVDLRADCKWSHAWNPRR